MQRGADDGDGHGNIDLGAQDNKDAMLFPEPVPAPDGRWALAMIHRPTFEARYRDWVYGVTARHGCGERRPSMWISRRFLVFSQPPLRAFSGTGATIELGTAMD